MTLRRPLHRALGIGAAATLTLMMVACIEVPRDVESDEGAPTASPAVEVPESPTASAAHAPELSDLVVGTLLATGEFNGAALEGRVELRADGTDSGFEVSLIGIEPSFSAGATLELNAMPLPASEAALRQGLSSYRYEPLAQASEQSFRMPSGGAAGFRTSDPSYLRTVVIWAAPPGSDFGFGEVLATAPLTWILPDMRPALEVLDHGVAEGAMGEIRVDSDGAPIAYQVAEGDTSVGIAGRFGVTRTDLEWLNPDRTGSELIRAGNVINLERGLRGTTLPNW